MFWDLKYWFWDTLLFSVGDMWSHVEQNRWNFLSWSHQRTAKNPGKWLYWNNRSHVGLWPGFGENSRNVKWFCEVSDMIWKAQWIFKIFWLCNMCVPLNDWLAGEKEELGLNFRAYVGGLRKKKNWNMTIYWGNVEVIFGRLHAYL